MAPKACVKTVGNGKVACCVRCFVLQAPYPGKTRTKRQLLAQCGASDLRYNYMARDAS